MVTLSRRRSTPFCTATCAAHWPGGRGRAIKVGAAAIAPSPALHVAQSLLDHGARERNRADAVSVNPHVSEGRADPPIRPTSRTLPVGPGVEMRGGRAGPCRVNTPSIAHFRHRVASNNPTRVRGSSAMARWTGTVSGRRRPCRGQQRQSSQPPARRASSPANRSPRRFPE